MNEGTNEVMLDYCVQQIRAGIWTLPEVMVRYPDYYPEVKKRISGISSEGEGRTP